MRNTMVEVFEDTMRRIREDEALSRALEKSINGSVLYLSGWKAPGLRRTEAGVIRVEECTSFEAARARAGAGERLAVLNFANPYEPGGGVTRGAMAQEECLCRVSTLYPALNTPYFLEQYYGFHNDLRNAGEDKDLLFSDRAIYTPGVAVFKDDACPPEALPEPFETDVITCAAPYNCGTLPAETLSGIFEKRIAQILEIAAGRGVDRLILGAFGCGAFENDPVLVAGAFRKLLMEDGYNRCFREAVFAIKPARVNRNLEAFRRVLGQE